MSFCSIGSAYIIGKLYKPFILVFIVISLITWFSQSIRILEILSHSEDMFLCFLRMSIYILPYLWYLIIPIAVLITITSVLNQMSNHKEILIMHSLGINKFNVILPFLYGVTLITLTHYFLSFYLMSTAYHHFRDLQIEAKKQYGLSLLQENTFATQVPGITIYIGKKNHNQLKQIFIDDHRNPQKQITIFAEKGIIQQNVSYEDLIISLESGSYQEFNIKQEINPILTFAHYHLRLPIYSEGNLGRKIDIHEQPTIQMLYSANAKDKAYGHQRLIWPLYSLVFTFLTLYFFIVSNKSIRKKYVYSIFICILLTAISFLLQGLAIKSSNIIILMYFIPIFCLLIVITKLICNR